MTFTTPTKISELERELVALRAIYGDIDVCVFAPDWRGNCDWRPVVLRIGKIGSTATANVVKLEG